MFSSRRNLNIPGQSENLEFTFSILISLVFYSYTYTATHRYQLKVSTYFLTANNLHFSTRLWMIFFLVNSVLCHLLNIIEIKKRKFILTGGIYFYLSSFIKSVYQFVSNLPNIFVALGILIRPPGCALLCRVVYPKLSDTITTGGLLYFLRDNNNPHPNFG